MQITGLVVDGETKTPMEAAHVVISREGRGDEIASLRTGADGRFVFDDDLNEYLGQQLAFTVEHRGYRPHRVARLAERGLTVSIPMSPDPLPTPPPVRPSLWARLARWFAGLTRGQRLALAAGPIAALCVLLAVGLAGRFFETRLACDFATIRGAASSDDPSLLWTIAGICERENKGELRFTAIEQCAMREHGPCLITMAEWYDPEQGARPTPFPQRNAVLATQYYRRARNQGVEDARARLDALCGALRQRGGQDAAEASC